MTAKVDIRNSQGVALQSMQKNETMQTDLYDQQTIAALKHVQTIIDHASKTN